MNVNLYNPCLHSPSMGDYLSPLQLCSNSPFLQDPIQVLSTCKDSEEIILTPKIKATWNPPYQSNSNLGRIPFYLRGNRIPIGKFLGNPLPGESKVVFLSEMHIDYLQNRVRQHYMNEIMKDGDFLLLEGRVFGKSYLPIHSRSFLIKHKITLDGWEQEGIKERAKIFSGQYSRNLYNKIIMDERNEYMVEIIKTILIPKLKDDQRIFVIAGARHINQNLLKKFPGIYTALFFNNFPLPVFPSTDAIDEREPTVINGIVSKNSIPKLFEIQLKDGSKHQLESHWFECSEVNQVGDKIKFTPDLFLNRSLAKSINIALGKTIRDQINIHDNFEILSIFSFANVSKNNP